MADQLDFVAIGDITTDEFIELDPENALITDGKKAGREQICMNFGDKLEYLGAVNVPAVGNSPNAAVSAHRLGLASALATNIGDDKNGEEVREQLEKEGVDLRFLKTHPGKETNHHYVLRYKAERTILVKHEDYDYELPDLGEPKWLYFSSVGENSMDYHHAIAAYVKEHEGTKLAFQPGTFQIKLGYEKLKDVYEASELFFCNKEEAQSILETDAEDIRELLKLMHDRGVTMPVITDGREGAYVYEEGAIWHMPMYPDPAPPVDRTGAGDSFSSTFTAMLALGKSVPEALARGPINSMSVVQYIGAQEGLLSMEKLEEYLANAPDDYRATQVA